MACQTQGSSQILKFESTITNDNKVLLREVTRFRKNIPEYYSGIFYQCFFDQIDVFHHVMTHTNTNVLLGSLTEIFIPNRYNVYDKFKLQCFVIQITM